MILWTITKLTCKSALRSHIFQLLLVILISCIIIVPNTISGDGTAEGFIQVSLKYSLSIIGFILSFSTIWLSCFSMTNDVESYRLHMVITKPASRIKIWLGKCLGVLLINFILLIISSAVIYSFIMWQFYNKPFSEKSRSKIENEVLVARRVYMPDLPNVEKLVDKEIERRRQIATKKGTINDLNFKMMTDREEIKKKMIMRLGEVPSHSTRPWIYSDVPKLDAKTKMSLRYRTYVGKISTKAQRQTHGLWSIVINRKTKETETGDIKVKSYAVPVTRYPQKFMCGVFHEIDIPAECISKDNQVMVAFTNYDLEGKSLYFQGADGPKLLVKHSSFGNNYCRAVTMIMIKLVVLAGISCAVASLLSMPTAIFFVISYLLFGSFSTYVLGSGIGTDSIGSVSFADSLARIVSHVLLIVVIPMQEFEITGLIANGELIEFSTMLNIFLKYVILRGIPIFALGIFIYHKREMGLVIKND